MSVKLKKKFGMLLVSMYSVLVGGLGVAFAKNNSDCNFIEINQGFYNSKSPILSNFSDNMAVVLKLNNNGGNYLRTLNLANKVREAAIPVIIERGAKCSNDCSAVFLASPIRHSNIEIFFPHYSPSEKSAIESLKPNEFYPVIKRRSVLQFLTEGLSEPIQNKLFTSYLNPKYSLDSTMNTPELKWLSTSALDRQTCNEIVSTKLAPTVSQTVPPDE